MNRIILANALVSTLYVSSILSGLRLNLLNLSQTTETEILEVNDVAISIVKGRVGVCKVTEFSG